MLKKDNLFDFYIDTCIGTTKNTKEETAKKC